MDCRKDRQAMLSDFAPNGLLPDKATSLAKELNKERWSRAEGRTAKMLAQILPTPRSEEQRNAVVSYLRRLIMENTPCEVFTFGSVPLKTYLPDGDIDLTAFSDNKDFKDNLVHEVRDILEREGKNENAEFRVKEVQYIQAEVTILKCLVDDFVVDISFNQISGLCTLCFLEEVDNLIMQHHLFKRSIILVKAWCFHESRILGAHHGLISSYALETLVLYIFHVYNNVTFAGPLEVLFRFLDFFSKFDWNNYCISLWGPVPISSLPSMKAEPPVKDCQKLLLTEVFLHACETFYGVKRRGRENQELPFVPKHMNIVDPLCANNNLGRSISKSNFSRIKGAIAYGAHKLLRLLDCQDETLIAEFDFFFRNTWDRHGNGHWIHLTSYNLLLRNNNVENCTHHMHESEVEQDQAIQGSHGVSQNPALHLEESKGMVGTSDVASVSQTRSTNTNDIFTGTMTSDINHTSSMKNALTDKGKIPMYSSNKGHDMHQLPSAHSSPEFDNFSSEFPPLHKQTGVSERESGKIRSASLVIDNSKRSSSMKNAITDKGKSPMYSSNEGHDMHQLPSAHSSTPEFDHVSSEVPSQLKQSGVSERESGKIHSASLLIDNNRRSSSMKNALTNKGIKPMYPSNEGHDMHQLPLAHSSPEFVPLSSEFPPLCKQTGVSERRSGKIHSASSMIDNSRRSSSRSEVLGNQHSSWKSLHDWRSEDAIDSKNASYCEFGSGENNEIGLSVYEAMRMHQEVCDLMNITETYRNHSFNGYPQAPFNVNSSNKPFAPPPPGFKSVFPPVNVPSFGSFRDRHMPNSQGLLPLPASVRMTLNKEEVDYNVVAAHLDHDKSTEAFWSEQDKDGGSRSCNSSRWTSLGSYFPKDYWKTTEHKLLSRENDSDDPPNKIPTNGDVNYAAISTYTPASPSTTRSKPSSSSLSPSLTSQPLDTDLAQRTTKIVTSDVQAHQSASFMPAMGSNSLIPYTPALLVSPGSSQRAVDNKGVSSFAFGPSRPPFPPTTNFPLFNLPNETGLPYTPALHMDMNAELGNLQACLSSLSLDSTENSRQSNALLMPYVNQMFDILRADFMCHWTDLQHARLCENSQVQVPWPYPSSCVPPWYPPLLAQFPRQVSMRPPDLMNNLAYGPAPFPMMPNQYDYGFNQLFDQPYPDLAFRYRCGTGTFLPDPISYQNRYYRRKAYSYYKNERGEYICEKNDDDDDDDGREDNWNYNNSRARFASRGQFQFGDFVERMTRTNQSTRRRKRKNNASSSKTNSAANMENDTDPPLVISTDTNEATHQGESSHSASSEVSLVLLVHLSDTNEASHQGESSHSASNEVEKVERDSADPSPHQPSTPNSPGVQN